MTNTAQKIAAHTPGRYQQAGRAHAAQLRESLRIAESCALANKAECEALRAKNAALLAALTQIRMISHEAGVVEIARAALAAGGCAVIGFLARFLLVALIAGAFMVDLLVHL